MNVSNLFFTEAQFKPYSKGKILNPWVYTAQKEKGDRKWLI
jgi:hypothetical protein